MRKPPATVVTRRRSSKSFDFSHVQGRRSTSTKSIRSKSFGSSHDEQGEGGDGRNDHDQEPSLQEEQLQQPKNKSGSMRARTLRSIEYLAAHCSLSVLKRLSEEAKIITGFEEYDNEDAELYEWTVALDGNDDEDDDLDDDSNISDLSDDEIIACVVGSASESTSCESYGRRSSRGAALFLDSVTTTLKDVNLLGTDTNGMDDSRNCITEDATPQQTRSPHRSGMARRRCSLSSVYSHHYFPARKSLPYASKHKAALLFVDISGFTKLSTILDPDSLSRAINEYFQLIVNKITHHGGDVLKFAGDALFAEWRVSSHHSSSLSTENKKNLNQMLETNVCMNLGDCVTAAAICAAKIVSTCSDYPLSRIIRDARDKITLNVHCGISVGDLVSVHVGDDEKRRENLMLGEPIDAVAKAEALAKHGEVVACADAVEALSRTCTLDFDSGIAADAVVIARRSQTFFTPAEAYNLRYNDGDRTFENVLSKGVAKLVKGWKNSELLRFRKLVSLYAHPVVKNNDNADFEAYRSRDDAQARHLEEAELRNVFCMFIAPLMEVSLGENGVGDTALFEKLSVVMNITTRQLESYGGHLRQLIVDDKGLVMIATFGLRGSTSANMVRERGLPAATSIRSMLLSELQVASQIGATVGNAYCGVVGGVWRHEYAVLGPSVNLAARLMASRSNPGILVDDAVKCIIENDYRFTALPPVVAKGYKERVPVFEPMAKIEQKWEQIKKNKFVGRELELKKLHDIADDVLTKSSGSQMALLIAESGMGKSMLLRQALQDIKFSALDSQRSISITKYVNREKDVTTPLSCFSCILFEALKRYELDLEDPCDCSLSRYSSGIFSNQRRTATSVSGKSVRTAFDMTTADVARKLNSICEELGAPSEFVDLVGQYVLRMNFNMQLNTDEQQSGSISTSMLVEFMSKAFQMTAKDINLGLLIIDDVHWMDEMSWRVIQCLLESTSNLMVVCTTRPLEKYALKIDTTFWEKLHTNTCNNSSSVKLTRLEIGALDETETKSLICKTLGVKEESIGDRLFQNVFVPSSGVPIFVKEICEALKADLAAFGQNDCPLRFQYYQESAEHDNEYTSVDVLILQRIDRLSSAARTVLQIAAVFDGVTDLFFIVDVLHRLTSADGSEEATVETENLVIEGVRNLVNEGIFSTSYEDEGLTSTSSMMDNSGGSMDEMGGLEWCLDHDIWRRTALKIMLGDRKVCIHRAIALELECRLVGVMDYATRLNLFWHWKCARDFLKASDLALSIGESFSKLLLNNQCVEIYCGALDMLKIPSGSTDHIAGYSSAAVQAMTQEELCTMVKIHTELGKVYFNLLMMARGMTAYQDALEILNHTEAGAALVDRSVMLPIFSGLFVGIRYGAIKQDESCTYEQKLVAQFVCETRLNGDRVHYLRALAMQAEMFARFGNYKSALATHFKLRNAYDAPTHHIGISKAYGSDRAAQSIAMGSAWLIQMGRENEAYDTCDFVLNNLLPVMDPTNVHNAFVLLYPVLWLLKKNGESLRALQEFKRYVSEPFDRYYGEGAITPCLSMYAPLITLFELCGNQEREIPEFQRYLDWGLNIEQQPTASTALGNAIGNFGRFPDTVSAEICFLLAKRTNDAESRTKLIHNGHFLAEMALAREEERKAYPTVFSVRLIFEELRELKLNLDQGL